MVAGILNDLLDLAMLAALWLIGAGLGRLILHPLVGADMTALERLLFGGALGIGVLMYATLAVGLLGLLNPLAMIIMLALLATVALSQWRGLVADLSAAAHGLRQLGHGRLTLFLMLATLAVTLITLVGAFSPPVDWDPLVYHLAFASSYVREGRIYDFLSDYRGMLPQGMEMLYTLALTFGRENLTALLHWYTAAVTAITIYALCRRYLHSNRGFALFAALIYLSIPLVIFNAGTANVDLGLGMFDFLSLYAFLNWRLPSPSLPQRGRDWPPPGLPRSAGEESPFQVEGEESLSPSLSPGGERSSRWLIVIGLMFGLGYACKQITFVNAAIVIALIIWQILRSRQGLRRAAVAVLLVGTVAAIVAAVWLIRSWLATGSPVWPWLYGVFDGKYWDAASAAFQNNGYSVLYGMRYAPGTTYDATGIQGQMSLLNTYLTWPWNMTMHPGQFNSVDTRSQAVGPLFLAILPVVGLTLIGRWLVSRTLSQPPLAEESPPPNLPRLAGEESKRTFTLLSIYAALYLAIWVLLLTHIVRFLASVMPALAILTAGGIYLLGRFRIGAEEGGINPAPIEITRIFLPYRAVLIMLVVGCLLISVIDYVGLDAQELPVAIGLQSRHDYLAQRFPPYLLLDQLNSTLGANDKVLMGYGALAYYLDKPYIYGEHVPGYVGRYRNRPVTDFIARLKQLGITYIVIADPSQAPAREVFPKGFLLDQNVRGPYIYRLPVPAGASWRLYRVDYSQLK